MSLVLPRLTFLVEPGFFFFFFFFFFFANLHMTCSLNPATVPFNGLPIKRRNAAMPSCTTRKCVRTNAVCRTSQTHNWQLRRYILLQPTLQGYCQAPHLAYDVLNGLLGAAVALRNVRRRNAKDCLGAQKLRDGTLECKDGRLTIRLETNVLEASCFQIPHELLDDPLVARPFGCALVSQRCA